MGVAFRSTHLHEQGQYHRDCELHYSVLAFLTGHRGTGDGTDELLKIEVKPSIGPIVRRISAEAEQILELRAGKTAARKRTLENLAAYHAQRARKFDRAVISPWLSVSLEPRSPEPE
jgi:hypothetical protein